MASRRRRRLAAAGAAVGLVWVLAPGPAGAGGPAPEPAYQRTLADAVTADNPPVAFGHPGGGCPPERPCPLPDPNPAEADGIVDNYTADVYERPTLVGPGGPAVVEAIDILSARVGSDAEHLYYRIDLVATAPGGGLPHAYGFELDYDDGDSAGDTLVTVAGEQVGADFAGTGVVGLWNRASTISGPTPGLPDEPGATPPGFEVRAFDGGRNLLPGSPGGDDAIVARIAPDRPASIEVAVRRGFLAAVNEGAAVTKVAFRPDASLTRLPVASYAVHDRLRRAEAGSPFPFLAKVGAPRACPSTERALPPAERIALDSGTASDTGRPNPCYPAGALSGYDNTAFVVFDPRTSTGAGEGAPDLAVSATHRGDLARGRRAELRLAVRNVGTGPTTAAITLTDRLPAGLRAESASGRGWACSVGRTVSCTTRTALAPGRAGTVVVSVAVEARGAREVRNRADVVTPGDVQVANNTAADVARVVRPARFPAALLLGAGASAVGLLLVVVRTVVVRTVVVRTRRRRRPEPWPGGSAHP